MSQNDLPILIDEERVPRFERWSQDIAKKLFSEKHEKFGQNLDHLRFNKYHEYCLMSLTTLWSDPLEILSGLKITISSSKDFLFGACSSTVFAL